MSKPLFKFAGSKTWLCKSLATAVGQSLSERPTNHYAELFTGGMMAFMYVHHVLTEHGVRNVTLQDPHQSLMVLYQTVIDNPRELIEEYNYLEGVYAALLLREEGEKQARIYYNIVRAAFNTKQHSLVSCAQLMFLQNHGYYGLFRVNREGMYNVPCDQKSKIVSPREIEGRVFRVRKVLRQFDVEFKHCLPNDTEMDKDSLYLVSPSYMRDDDRSTTSEPFCESQQLALLEKLKGHHFVYTNHDDVRIRAALTGVACTVEVFSREGHRTPSNLVKPDIIVRSH